MASISSRSTTMRDGRARVSFNEDSLHVSQVFIFMDVIPSRRARMKAEWNSCANRKCDNIEEGKKEA